MPDLTPQPLSDEDIDTVFASKQSKYALLPTRDAHREYARAIIAARDEQWRTRLEVVGIIDGEGYLWNDLTKCTYPEDFIVYRINEQTNDS